MAYSFASASSQFLSAANPVAGVPLTLAAWFRVGTQSDSAARTIIQLSWILGNTDANRGSYRVVIPGSTTGLRAVHDPVSSSSANATTASGTILANTWMHAAGVFASNSSRTVYLSGASSVTNTTSLADINVTHLHISAHPAGSSYTSATVAEVAVWSAALTAAEIASLQQAISPMLVRPQSLAFYAPLVRDLIDVRGGLTLTNNNAATAASHPRVYAA